MWDVVLLTFTCAKILDLKFQVWLKTWMKIVELKDVLRIKRFLLKNCLQPKQY